MVAVANPGATHCAFPDLINNGHGVIMPCPTITRDNLWVEYKSARMHFRPPIFPELYLNFVLLPKEGHFRLIFYYSYC